MSDIVIRNTPKSWIVRIYRDGSNIRTKTFVQKSEADAYARLWMGLNKDAYLDKHGGGPTYEAKIFESKYEYGLKGSE